MVMVTRGSRHRFHILMLPWSLKNKSFNLWIKVFLDDFHMFHHYFKLIAMNLKKYHLLITVLVLLFHSHRALSAAFNCEGNVVIVEITICKSVQLSALDDVFFQKYSAVKAGLASANESDFLKDHYQWLIQRNECEDDEDCILASYTSQIRILDSILLNRSAEQEKVKSIQKEKITVLEKINVQPTVPQTPARLDTPILNQIIPIVPKRRIKSLSKKSDDHRNIPQVDKVDKDEITPNAVLFFLLILFFLPLVTRCYRFIGVLFTACYRHFKSILRLLFIRLPCKLFNLFFRRQVEKVGQQESHSQMIKGKTKSVGPLDNKIPKKSRQQRYVDSERLVNIGNANTMLSRDYSIQRFTVDTERLSTEALISTDLLFDHVVINKNDEFRLENDEFEATHTIDIDVINPSSELNLDFKRDEFKLENNDFETTHTSDAEVTNTSTKLNLDFKRIAHLQIETDEVSSILIPIYNQVEPLEEVVMTDDQYYSIKDSIMNLNDVHSAFIRQISKKQIWNREELISEARQMDLMLDGSLELINEAAFEYFDHPLTEGDDPIEINCEVLELLKL